jgi:hypothetical protein
MIYSYNQAIEQLLLLSQLQALAALATGITVSMQVVPPSQPSVVVHPLDLTVTVESP